MMDPHTRGAAAQAIAHLSAAIESGPEASHEDICAAFQAIVALRDQAIDGHCRGEVTDECRDRVNSLVSLAFGGEFPLSGFHVRRLEQTREGVRQLLADAAAADTPPEGQGAAERA